MYPGKTELKFTSRKNPVLRTGRGFTLLEILIAIGLTGILALGTVSLINLSMKSQKNLKMTYDLTDRYMTVSQILNNEASCALSGIVGMKIDPNDPEAKAVVIHLPGNGAPGPVFLQEGTLPEGGWKISRLRLARDAADVLNPPIIPKPLYRMGAMADPPYPPATPSANAHYRGVLMAEPKKLAPEASLGPAVVKPKEFKVLHLYVDETVPFPNALGVNEYEIKACYLQSSDSACGSQGMLHGPAHAKADPGEGCVQSFQVKQDGTSEFADAIKVGPHGNDSDNNCPGLKGYMRYNDTMNRMEYCDGAVWNQLGSNGDDQPDPFGDAGPGGVKTFLNMSNTGPDSASTCQTLTGFNGPLPVTPLSPDTEIRTSGGSWQSGASSIPVNHQLCVRPTVLPTWGQSKVVQVKVGNALGTFTFKAIRCEPPTSSKSCHGPANSLGSVAMSIEQCRTSCSGGGAKCCHFDGTTCFGYSAGPVPSGAFSPASECFDP